MPFPVVAKEGRRASSLMEKRNEANPGEPGTSLAVEDAELPVCDKAFSSESARIEDEDSPCRNAEN